MVVRKATPVKEDRCCFTAGTKLHTIVRIHMGPQGKCIKNWLAYTCSVYPTQLMAEYKKRECASALGHVKQVSQNAMSKLGNKTRVEANKRPFTNEHA